MYRCLECDDSFFEDHEFDNHECVTRLRITYCSSVFTDGSNCQNKAVEKWGGDPVCLNCFEACERGYQKSLKEDH